MEKFKNPKNAENALLKTDRLITLLRNTLEYLEEMVDENIIGTDIEDAIGITQEEYDELMENKRGEK